jgi:hypothetical protein
MKHLKRFEYTSNWKDEFYSLLEKKIAMGDSLNKKLNKLSGENDTLARKMLQFFNSDDIKDDANATKVDYNKEDGKLLTLTDDRGRERKFKFGKLLKYLGYDTANIKPYEVENFLLNFTKAETKNLREVSGDDILYSYHCKNYDELEKVSGGSLGFSCMRFEQAQKYLKIYTSNPKQVSCLTLFNPENNKVQGRALIWTMDNGKRYMDRIYTLSKEISAQFINYAEENNIGRKANSTVTLEVDGDYDYYPYMDTYNYYTPDTGVLSTSDGKLQLLSTTGGSTDGDTVWSDFYHEDIASEDAVYSRAMDSYIYRHDATEVISEIDDNGKIVAYDWIIDDESVHGLAHAVTISYTSEKFSEVDGLEVLSELCLELEGGDAWVLEADEEIWDDSGFGNLVKVEKLSWRDFDVYYGENYCIQVTYDGSRYASDSGYDYIPYGEACAFYNPIEDRFDIIHEEDDWDDFMEEMYGDDSDVEYDRDKWDWNDYEQIGYMNDQKYTERVFVHSSLLKDPENTEGVMSDDAPIALSMEGDYVVKSDENYAELHDNVYIESSKLETSCFKTNNGYRLFPVLFNDVFVDNYKNLDGLIDRIAKSKMKPNKEHLNIIKLMRKGKLMENNLLRVLEDTNYYTFHNFKDAKFVSNRRMEKRPDYTKGLIKDLENFINDNDSIFDFVNQFNKKTKNEDFMIHPSQVSFFGSYYMHKEEDNVNMIFPYIVSNDDKYLVYRTKNRSFKLMEGSEIMQMFQKKLF